MLDWALTSLGATQVNAGFGSPLLMTDEDNRTFASASVGDVITITFAQTITLGKIHVRAAGTGTYTPAYYNGAWVSGAAIPFVTTGVGLDWGYYWLFPTGIAGVSKIRLTSAGAGPVYTFSAFGDYFQDKGLRWSDGTDTHKLAVRTLVEAEDRLRVRIGGITYSVPVVGTDHTQASAVRIYDGSAVKALVDIT